MQHRDEMLDLLKAEGLNPRLSAGPGSVYERKITFTIDGVWCWIEWWANVAYLSIGGPYASYFAFTEIRIDTTWPHFRRGLKFIRDDSDETLRVAIKKLDWQIDSANKEP